MERPLLFTVALGLALSPVALRADEADDRAKAAELAAKLENPVADPVSVPVKNNWDFGIGPANAMRYYLAQPEDGPDWGLSFKLTFLFPK